MQQTLSSRRCNYGRVPCWSGSATATRAALLKLRAVDLALNARNIADKRYISANTSADNALQGERRSVWLTAKFAL